MQMIHLKISQLMICTAMNEYSLLKQDVPEVLYKKNRISLKMVLFSFFKRGVVGDVDIQSK